MDGCLFRLQSALDSGPPPVGPTTVPTPRPQPAAALFADVSRGRGLAGTSACFLKRRCTSLRVPTCEHVGGLGAIYLRLVIAAVFAERPSNVATFGIFASRMASWPLLAGSLAGFLPLPYLHSLLSLPSVSPSWATSTIS